jgi:hypothetical protein
VNPRANRLQIAQHVGDRDAALEGGDLDAPAQGQRDVAGQVGSPDQADANPCARIPRYRAELAVSHVV